MDRHVEHLESQSSEDSLSLWSLIKPPLKERNSVRYEALQKTYKDSGGYLETYLLNEMKTRESLYFCLAGVDIKDHNSGQKIIRNLRKSLYFSERGPFEFRDRDLPESPSDGLSKRRHNSINKDLDAIEREIVHHRDNPPGPWKHGYVSTQTTGVKSSQTESPHRYVEPQVEGYVLPQQIEEGFRS